MKNILTFVILYIVFLLTGYGQKPSIVYTNKSYGTATEIVDIAGTGFSTDPSKLKVFFGAVQGDIINSTESLIKVKVPTGASYDNIKVINLTSKLSGSSSNQFMLSFGGEEFLSSKLSSNEIYTGAPSSALGALLDFCLCDLDGDKKIDWIAGHDQASIQNGLYVVRNTSSIGTTSSTFSLISLPAQISYVACGDINNDGKPDLAAVRGNNNSISDRIYVLINSSTGVGNIGFLPFQVLEVPNARNLSKVKIEDLDNDGLPEVIVTDNTNQSQPGINDAVHIFKNKSSNGTAAFESPTTIRIQDDASVTGDEFFTSGVFALEVKDLNKDGFPELIIAPQVKPNVCIIQNTSAPGRISFGTKTFLPVVEALSDIKIAEINGDSKPDIVVAKFDASRNFSVLINETGNDGVVKFGAAVTFPLSKRSSSLDVGDLNGDGKTDIVLSSIESTNSAYCILINNSTTTPSFTENVVPIRTRQSAVKIADMDNDGRPDISIGLNDNRLGVILNKNCVVAKTKPAGSIEICSGNTLYLYTYKGINLTYAWKKNNVDVANSNNPFLNSVDAGEYKVTITSDNGACTSISAPINVTINAGTAPSKPTIVAKNPACMGEDLQFTGQDNGGAAQYVWSGPNGWSSTLQNPLITSVKPQHAGYYTLHVVSSNGCISKKDTMLVNVLSLPVIEIVGPDAICSGTAATLSVANFGDHQYQWKFNGNVLSNKTTSSIGIDQVGTYNAIILKSGCSYESKAFNLESIALPQAAFDVKAEACINESVAFTDKSTIPLQRDVTYHWEFGDGITSNLKNPTNSFTTIGNYNVKLKLSYTNTTCISEAVKPITIRQAEAITIAAGSDIFCSGDSVKLEAQGTYPSYEWSNNKNTKAIYVKEAGTYTVKITDQTGCSVSANISVSQYPKNELNVSTVTGETNIEFGKNIQLSANDQYIDYLWSPASGLSDVAIYNPLASPRQTTTYTLSALDENGCKLSESIIITVDGNGIKLKTAKIFTPNGDSHNQYWEIEDVENYHDNEVLIFDGQGQKVFEASPYVNNWDAVFNGKPLPAGVYYFVIKLKETGTVQSGTIMVVR